MDGASPRPEQPRAAAPEGSPAAASAPAPIAVLPDAAPAVAAPDDDGEKLWGWGRLPVPGHEQVGEDLVRLTEDLGLSRGLGRSYGDSSLPPPGTLTVAGTRLADRFLGFDEDTGVLRAEAGLSLAEVLRVLFPRGWFPPVTPGTKFVTLGGMVASDVHGKNHHVDGTFGQHVRSLKMRVADGRILECSPEQHPDLFWATVGGMGLTGHILEVEFTMTRIPSPWIWMESERIPNLDAFVSALGKAAGDWPMTMGWIDCLSRGSRMGRGILMAGRWATAEEAPKRFPRPKRRLTVPFVFPGFVVNGLSMRVFNELVYRKHWRRRTAGIVHPETFFWPLDQLLEWNRGYGPRGFTQYQCVVPHAPDNGPARRFMDLLTRLGGASMLCVLKDCGAEGKGMLSFPKPGVSIAVDLPVRDRTQEIVDRLNELVIEEGGRIYLTKDAFTRPEHFAAMEPRLAAFAEVRRRWDPTLRFKSAQSVRVLGDPA